MVGWKVGLDFLLLKEYSCFYSEMPWHAKLKGQQTLVSVLHSRNYFSLGALKILCSASFGLKYNYWLYTKRKREGFLFL